MSKSERDNFVRLGIGIVDVGTEISREILMSKIVPSELHTKININIYPHHLFKSLNQKQKDLVRNICNDGYSKFDISLIYLILSKVCANFVDPCARLPKPTQGWNKDPKPEDVTLSDDVERLRLLRNTVFAHSPRSSISELEYRRHWQQLIEIASRMKDNHEKDYVAELLKLERCKFSDCEEERLFDEIKSWKVSLGDHEIRLRQHITDESEVQSQGIKRHISDTAEEQNQELKRFITDAFDKTTDKCQLPAILPSNSEEDIKQKVEKLKEIVFEINERETRNVSLSPLQEMESFPFDLLYTSMKICDDARFMKEQKSSYPWSGRKGLKYPEDMLIKEGKPVRRAYMLGDAAHGKTSYCLGLLMKWLNARTNKFNNKWTQFLVEFDFMFYLPLRIADPSRYNVVDMLCNDVFEEHPELHSTIRYVLSKEKYRCFIIIDGLDEWNPNEDALSHLKCKALPQFTNISNALYFITTRPWKFDAVTMVTGSVSLNDRVIKIQGLDKQGIINLTTKVLKVKYGLKNETAYPKAKHKFMSKLEEDGIVSLMQIPLLAVVCVQLWYEGKYKVDTMTSFYAALLDMLIERTSVKYQDQRIFYQRGTCSLPEIFEEYRNITYYASLLLHLGKVAFEGLFSKENALVFSKRILEDELGHENLKFCLEVGIISQREEPSLLKKEIRVQFFHKSMQEFLAAAYLATNNDLDKVVFTHKSSIYNVFELSNLIKFVCGINSSLGGLISRQVVSLARSAENLIRFRESPGVVNSIMIGSYHTSEELYVNTIKWFKEMNKQKITEESIDFHVSEVILTKFCDITNVNIGKIFLRKCYSSIMFLYLDCIDSNEENGISEEEIHAFLSNAKSLLSFYVDGYKCGRKINQISVPSLQTLHVKSVRIQDKHPRIPLLKNMPLLETLVLDGLYDIRNKDIGLSSCMSNLKLVCLQSVKMKKYGWQIFLQSLLSIRHRYDIILENINMYDAVLKKIIACAEFTDVNEDFVEVYNDEDEEDIIEPVIKFSRKWPLTDVAQ